MLIKSVVFVSNYLNVHQLPLCLALKKRCDSFVFVALTKPTEGVYQKEIKADFVFDGISAQSRQAAIDLVKKADVAIFGNCPNVFIEERVKTGKLSFIYSERFFKGCPLRRFFPKTRENLKKRILDNADKNLYVLCAGAYLANELATYSFPKNKVLKWGYFPANDVYNVRSLLEAKRKNSILWAGRLLKWKHPEYAVKVAAMLKRAGYDFSLSIVGDGEQYSYIKALIQKFGVDDKVVLTGSLSGNELKRKMEETEIFLFTSDGNEGWGAVLNEAMNAACAVVADRRAGSTPYLIKNGENGVIYDGKIKSLFDSVVGLLEDNTAIARLGAEAYESIKSVWNAEVASIRLINFALGATKNGVEYPSDGPCSLAEKVKVGY